MADAERGADLVTMLRLSGADSRMVQAVVAEHGPIASHVVHRLSKG
jgi:hypothetical protein